jgi:cell division protein FtsI/penicillin-binding protein 2
VASVSAREGKVLSEAKPALIPANVLSLSPEDAQDVTELMLKACKDKGTAVALGNAMGEQGFSVAAKTGTAEIDVNTGKGIISWIVAFAEEEPLAFLVCANNPASSQAAVNLAVEFMPEAMKLIAGDV